MLNNVVHENGYWIIPDKKYRFDKGLASGIAKFADKNSLHSILDVGCGNGAYTFFLKAQDFDVEGYDGNPYTEEITGGECGVVDFSEVVMIRPRDLIICLEVAEHVPAEKEEVFVENLLLSESDYVIISWAVEGQGGLGHINCRNNDYVIDLFKQYGYDFMEKESEQLRKASKISWFKNTVMVFS